MASTPTARLTVLRKTVSRGALLELMAQLPRCLIGMEACSGAHQLARDLQPLGHQPRIMMPKFIIPYRRNQKNDGNDAEAICEAAARPNMRFVPIKSVERQVLHEVNARSRALDEDILAYDRRISAQVRDSAAMQRIVAVCGVGPITASAVVASVSDAKLFRNGRQFAAWLGRVPRQFSTGGKPVLGRINRQGDVYLRTLLIHGARSALLALTRRDDKLSRWAGALIERRGFKKACVAPAAKNARVIWVRAYESVSQARAWLARFIEFYNTRRPHSSLDRKTPDEFYFASLSAMKKAA